jgi:nucleoside-diphosphate-sugar epimerase
VRTSDRAPVRIGDRAMDATRAREELAFTPAWPFARGFPALVDWFRRR